MIRIALVSIFIGIPLLVLFLLIPYTYYVCVKYIKDNKR